MLLERINNRLKKVNIWKVSTLVLSIGLVLSICLLLSVKNAQNLTYSPVLNDSNNNSTVEVPSGTDSVLPKPPNNSPHQTSSGNSQHQQEQSVSYSEGIKVYGADFPNELTSFNWGTIYVGVPKNYSISVLNFGNQPVSLKLQITNWTSGVDANMTWNYDGKPVPANTIVPITLTLTVRNTNTTIFSNNIIITATDA